MAKRKSKGATRAMGTSGTASTGDVKARYDAAGHGRRMMGWNPASSGPNRAIVGLQTLRNRSHDATRNDWSGESTSQKWTTSLIGIGITPRFKRIKSKTRKQLITDLWNEFVAQSDADGVLNVYGQQTLAVRSWLVGGEVFARRRFRRLEDGLAVPVQVQLIEAEFVPMLDSDAWPGMPQGNRIRSGIELDKIGRRVAYWMYREHPGDGASTITANMLVRVPASEIRHIMEQKRPGQLRGVPALAPVLARLRNINDYDDAVLERQKLANLFVAFLTRTMPGAESDIDIDPLTNLPIEWGSNGEPLAGMQPGMTQELDPGQDVKFANPPEAGTTYSDYMRTAHMGTAAAAGIPYELFAGDIANVSDRTLRVLINEFRRLAEQRQWQIVIPMFCQPVIDWFAEAALLAGQITVDELADVKRVEHAPHGWQYIHPVQDPQGKKLEVEAGFRSRSSVIAERGDDPDTVDDERAADKTREKSLGLNAPPPAPSNPNKTPPKKPEPTQHELAQISLINAQVDVLRREPPAAPKAEAPNITINVGGSTIENKLPEQAPPVVNNTLNIPETVVNVEAVMPAQPAPLAPIVNIENNVPPAEVNVTLAPRKTETTVEYDAKGNISKATQIESDLEDAPAQE